MRLADLEAPALRRLLARGELLLATPPFVVRVTSDLPQVAEALHFLYRDFGVLPPDRFSDFRVEVRRVSGVRGWLKPQARFSVDGREAFLPLPQDHAPVMLEWGLNWCVVAHAHQYLILHAAVVERDGRALILPAPPGSGKSTLCAALAHRGWRLLSDELALCDLRTGTVSGMARPVNLKNQSVELISRFAPEARFSRSIAGTAKGTLSLMCPPAEAVSRVCEAARPGWIVLPRYGAGEATTLSPIARTECFMEVTEQAYNYNVHGAAGFSGLARLVGEAECFRLVHGDLDAAVALLDALAPQTVKTER
ncbi:MAG: HprK-related kinase A [Betaproteobacteria bacterium]|nr:HprK-related kinase A [Betaproteobacteria bacterium]MCC6250812.1 HprK-related kinase A [Rubrivivax sp.]